MSRSTTTEVPALDYDRGEFYVPCLKERPGETLEEFVARVKAAEEAVKAACSSV